MGELRLRVRDRPARRPRRRTATIVAWDYEAWSPSLGGRPGYDTPGQRRHRHARWASSRRRSRRARRRRIRRPFDNGSNAAPSYVAGRVGGTRGGTGTVASERVLTHTCASPFFTGPLRSPARLQNTFAHESFMDEIAAHVKADPVAYRLRHLSDPRLSDVVAGGGQGGELGRAAVAASRARRGPASSRAAASSCVVYEGDNGYVRDGGRSRGRSGHADGSRVKRLVVAQDCGPISNPDGMRNQIEGGALQGMSRALGEEVTWDDHKVTSIDWRTYHSLSLGFDVPAIESVLINRHGRARRPARARPPSRSSPPRSATRSSTPPARAFAKCRSRPRVYCQHSWT